MLAAPPAAALPEVARTPSLVARTAAPVVKQEAQLEVRAAMSPRASEALGGRRVLRLLEIELDESTPLARRANGPLDEEIIRVWLDAPSDKVVLIEVQRTGRGVTRRKLSIGRFEPEIAARVVAIAASEMVHVHARPPRREQPAESKPGPAATDHGDAFKTAFALTSGLNVQWMPASAPDLVLGPEIALSHRRGPTGQELYARWLVNSYADQRLRWFEVGAGADLRIPLPEPTWRLHVGARAGGVALGLPQAELIDEAPTNPQSWSARAGALVGIEAALTGVGWLELAVEPGAILRSFEATDRAGQSQPIGGFTLNGSLALHVELPMHDSRRPPTPHDPPAPSPSTGRRPH